MFRTQNTNCTRPDNLCGGPEQSGRRFDVRRVRKHEAAGGLPRQGALERGLRHVCRARGQGPERASRLLL